MGHTPNVTCLVASLYADSVRSISSMLLSNMYMHCSSVAVSAPRCRWKACCTGHKPCQDGLGCDYDVCHPCGQKLYEVCCPGQTCPSVIEDQRATCHNDRCVPCGVAGEVPCAADPPCDAGAKESGARSTEQQSASECDTCCECPRAVHALPVILFGV
jgi:hypothetical protein